MIGANRAFCMVPSEWFPLPPICKCEDYLLSIRINECRFFFLNKIIHVHQIVNYVTQKQMFV
jgi:hypothetical protein